jgi:hypothetical protein
VNQSVDVAAPDYFLSTASLPVAEQGYYVFPVNLVKRLLEDDGLSDAGFVHRADPVRLAGLFGADTVLYIVIERWDARYAVLATTVTVQFHYVLKSGITGEELWRTRSTMSYTPESQSSGNPWADLIAAAITAAVAKAAPNYIPLAQAANYSAVMDRYQGLPPGPHHRKYMHWLHPVK